MKIDRDFYTVGDGAGELDVSLGHNGDPEVLGPGELAVRRGGRQPTYRPEYAQMVKKLCQQGFTDVEIAEFFQVHVATIYRWRAEYPDFAEATKIGKDETDYRVEQSLLRRAVGYERRTEKVAFHEGTILRAETVEHYPGDVKAQQWWLKNRKRDVWRESSEITGANGTALIPTDAASKLELARFMAFVVKQGAEAAEQLAEEEDDGS